MVYFLSTGLSQEKNNMPGIQTIFIGTPTFALPSLDVLSRDSFFDIISVITQPDRPVGRNQTLTEPPVKALAKKIGLTIYQPNKIRDFINEIRSLNPELIVLVAYGQVIPQEILDIPKYGCINVHGSLLPKYRGAAVIQAPIENGDTITGVTIMKMDAGLDTGPILSQASINIDKKETTATLFPKIAKLGADTLCNTLKKYIGGGIKPHAQDNSLASYVKILKKDDARINWEKSASEIERLTRAMYSWPITWTKLNDKILKIIEVDQENIQINQYRPGQIFINNGRLAVQCGINSLIIKKLQLEGKTEMTAEEFLRGQKDIIHQVLT